MMKTMQLLLTGLVVVLGLTACAGNTTRSGQSNSAERQSAEVNTSLGREYMERGQLEIALEKLKRAVAADSSYAPAQTMLAVLYERIDELDLAEKHYRKALDVAPANGDVNNNYGVFLCGTGRMDSATPYFLKAVKDPFYRTPAVALANAGACAMQAGKLDNAENYLRQSLEYDAEFPDALLAMSRVSLRKGMHLRARAFLQRYESVAAVTAESLDLGARIERQLGNEQNAKKYDAQIISQFPESKQAKEIRGAFQP